MKNMKTSEAERLFLPILNNGSIVLCDSCRRILHLEQPEPEA